MKFQAVDLYRAAMIEDRARIEYLENGVSHELVVEIMGIDTNHLLFRRSQSADRQEIALKDIRSIERLGLSSEDMAQRVAAFLDGKRRMMRNKANAMYLWKHFGAKLEALKKRVQMCEGCEALLAFLGNNSALSGDVNRQPIDEIYRQLDRVQSVLEKELLLFAEALIGLARRDLVGTMKAYLRDVGNELSEEFIRTYAAQLAVVSVQLGGKLSNDCAFIYWIDQLLKVEPEQVIRDEGIWLNYLEKCVTFQHFNPLCEVLRSIEDRKTAFEALAFVLAQNEQPFQACQALDVLDNVYGANYSIGQLLLQLVDDERSYCVRYANRVRCLLEENMIGREDVGYIYDYVRLRRHAHIVSGCLVSYFVNEKDVDERLLEYMGDCLMNGLDYEPDMIHFVPREGGVAINVER